jgi:hypothetical protein
MAGHTKFEDDIEEGSEFFFTSTMKIPAPSPDKKMVVA